MATKIAVNTGQISISDGSSFLVTACDGTINAKRAQGFFVRDTRLISYYEISINHSPLTLLAASSLTHRVALYQFTNPELLTVRGTLPDSCLIITVRRDINGGMHEDIDITNHHPEQVKFQLMLSVRSDFADIFQVKGKQLLARGKMKTTWKDGVLTTEYQNQSFRRGIIIAPDGASSSPDYANGHIYFDISLEPGEMWHSCINFIALADGDVLEPKHTSADTNVTEAGSVMTNFLDVATKLRSSNAEVTDTYQQALVDLGALRMEIEDNGHPAWMPVAGIPWFVSVFGRDSIVTSLQTMAVSYDFARGTLVKLAELQATEVDDSGIIHSRRENSLSMSWARKRLALVRES